MAEFVEMIQTIKKAALDAVEASKPVRIMFGTVINTSPLRINVEQKMILEENQITLTEKMYNLEIGDKVLLMRMQGGQNFIITDRLINRKE